MAINGWIDVKTQHKTMGGSTQISVENGIDKGVFIDLGEQFVYLSRKKAIRLVLAILSATHDIDEITLDGVIWGRKQ